MRLGIGETEEVMKTSNTHDTGALFGFDGSNMWIEQTMTELDSAETEWAANTPDPDDLTYSRGQFELSKYGIAPNDWPSGLGASWLREGIYSRTMLLQWMGVK